MARMACPKRGRIPGWKKISGDEWVGVRNPRLTVEVAKTSVKGKEKYLVSIEDKNRPEDRHFIGVSGLSRSEALGKARDWMCKHP